MTEHPRVNDPGLQAEPAQPVRAAPEIVSVNARGGRASPTVLRLALLSLAFAVLVSGALWGFQQYRSWKKARDEEAQQANTAQNKAALVGRRRTFSSDPEPVLPAAPKPAASASSPPCLESSVLLDANGQPVLSVTGAPMRICKDGKIFMPPGGAPIPLAQSKPAPAVPAVKPPSRYGGELMVPAKENAWGTASTISTGQGRPASSTGVDVNAQFARFLQQRGQLAESPSGAGSVMTVHQPAGGAAPAPRLTQGGTSADDGQGVPAGADPARPHNPTRAPVALAIPGGQASQGAVGALLTPSRIPMVSASLLGDRNLILPRGRTIDCSLATRVVNEVSGLAECVLASDVYSDNGQVVLLERGSQASGEYVALMTQGQRRLFILWTRVKTPHGVVINLASPASDALGAAGISGYVDHRWGERLGAAVLLSMVKDAIALATAQSVSSGGAGAGAGIYAFQTTSATGERMVNQVLNSTINIKPTLYANPGDRAAIYVARDLDFGTVYALRSR